MTELQRNTRVFDDPEPCPNPECVEGQEPEYTWDEFDIPNMEMVTCKTCKGENHI